MSAFTAVAVRAFVSSNPVCEFVFVVVLCALLILACAVLCSVLLVAVVDLLRPFVLCFVWW